MNTVKEQLDILLNKKMDRKDFIKQTTIGIVALTGFGTALRLLSPPKQPSNGGSSDGYGGSAYGGNTDSKKLG